MIRNLDKSGLNSVPLVNDLEQEEEIIISIISIPFNFL